MKKNYLACAVMALCFTITSFGQVSSYSLTPSIGTFTPLTGATDVNAIEADDQLSAPLPIGFTFMYDGQAFTKLKACSNGFITFDTLSTATSLTNNLTTNTLPLLAPLWDDQDGRATGTSTASFRTTGIAPNRIFTMEWLNWEWNYQSTTAVISYQVKLYEGIDEIEYVYRQESTAANTPSASIGLGSSSGFLSLQSTSTSPLTSALSENNSLSSKPVNGQIYRFIPPSCLTSSNIIQTTTSLTSVGVSWTTGGATEWQIDYGATGHFPGTGTVALITSTSNYNIPGLSPGSCYDVFIRDICAPSDTSNWAGPINVCTAFLAPMLENFDSNPLNVSGALSNGWSSNSLSGTTYNWFSRNSPTGSGSTGPGVDHTTGVNGGGMYMYTEASNGSSGNLAVLTSPPVDVNALTNPSLRFWYHKYGVNMPDFYVMADTGNGAFDVGLDTIFGATHTAEAPGDEWLESLVQFSGKLGASGVIQVRFESSSLGCCAGDGGIDDVEIFDLLANDASMSNLLQPVDGSCAGTITVEVEIKNSGADPILPGNLSVSYSIDGGTAVTEAVNATILPFDKGTFTFNQTSSAVAGNAKVVVWTNLAGDGFLGNDTLDTVTVIISPIIDTMLYCEGFENGTGGWSTSGTNSSWAIGTPAGSFINAAAAGSNAAVTNLSGQPNINENSYLLSPCFDFSAYENDPVLEFSHMFDNGLNENHFVELSTDGGVNWDKVGKQNAGINWYNSSPDVWGNSTTNGGWEKARHVLRGAAGFDNVKIRFVLITDGSVSTLDEGVGVDDITIVVPPNNLFLDTLSTCNDPNFTLDAMVYDSASYLWSTGDTTSSIAVTSGGTYTVTITDPKIGLSFTESVEVIVQAAPSISFGKQIDTIDFFGPTIVIDLNPKLPANYTYTWTNGSTITNFPFFHADPSELGVGMHTIQVAVQDLVGCTSLSQHQIFVSDFVGIETPEGNKISFYPNPVSSTLQLQFEGSKSLGDIRLAIVDYQGRQVLTKQLLDNSGSLSTSVDVSQLAKGMYLLQLETASGTWSEKLIIQ
jgi:hypothetical protein